MRNLVTIAVVLLLLAGTAMAAQPGQVPNATLAKLGLGQMNQMTDTQGQSIRGSGFAEVGGTSMAYYSSPCLGGSSSSGPNSYTAKSNPPCGSALAAGATGSVAGGFITTQGAGGAPTTAVAGLAVGGSAVAWSGK